MEITIEDFDKIEMRAGTVIDVEINKRARKPAYKVVIDFGDEIGINPPRHRLQTFTTRTIS